MISRLILTLISLLTLCACHIEPSEQKATDVSIAYLKSLCVGSHYRINSDYRLRGVIIASEWLGELYNSIIIKDESGHLEVMVDVEDVATRLPIYSEVEICCNGLMLARVGGKIEMGLPSTSDFALDNINDEVVDNHIRIIGQNSEISPETKRFDDIDASDISSIVRFEDVRIACEEGQRWCDTLDGEVVTTYRTLVDSEDNTFAIRILPTSHYALDEMPTDEISVIGAIDYADDRYFLTIVNGWITQ